MGTPKEIIRDVAASDADFCQKTRAGDCWCGWRREFGELWEDHIPLNGHRKNSMDESHYGSDVMDRASTALKNIKDWEARYGKGINLVPIITDLMKEVRLLRKERANYHGSA